MLIFIPTSLIHNQSEVHAKPNENDSGWQSFLVLFVLLCLSLHFSVCPSSQGFLTLIDSLVEPRGASIIFRERLMGSCPVYLMREGSRARSSTSRWQSLFFIPTLSQTNAKKINRCQYYSSAAFHWWEMQTSAYHYGLMTLIWFMDAQCICTISVICRY